MEEPQFQRKALYILRENVRALLDRDKADQLALDRWCGHEKSWTSKFLAGERGVTIKDLDHIASFFVNVQTYQLFQPGISRLTERRIGHDRRTGIERRLSAQGRELAKLRAEVDKLPRSASHGAPAARSTADLEIQRAIERAAREIHAIQSRQQAPDDGPAGARVSKDRRKVRRPAVKPA